MHNPAQQEALQARKGRSGLNWDYKTAKKKKKKSSLLEILKLKSVTKFADSSRF